MLESQSFCGALVGLGEAEPPGHVQGWLNTGVAARERFAGRVHPKAESSTDSRSAVAVWLCRTFTELCPWLRLAPSLTCAIPARSLPGMSRSAVCLSAALIQAVQSALPSVQRRLITPAGAGCCTGKTVHWLGSLIPLGGGQRLCQLSLDGRVRPALCQSTVLGSG